MAETHDVLVLHSGLPSVTPEDRYKECIVPMRKIGPFVWQSGVFPYVLSSQFNAIVVMADLRWIVNLLVIIIRHSKAKLIWWGPWLTQSAFANGMRIFLANRKHATLFYSEIERQRFEALGVDPKKLFVANNTIEVDVTTKAFLFADKQHFLSVGSLDERKQIDVVLRAFKRVVEKVQSPARFVIVGQGEQEKSLKLLSHELGISHRVDFMGNITDVSQLAGLYRGAIASVSYGQAGLAVLQSLGNGVPYVTKRNAISGGEISNIKHGVNGLLCEESLDSLEDALLSLCQDITYARKLGEQAHAYYLEHCTIQGMCKGFVSALSYSP